MSERTQSKYETKIQNEFAKYATASVLASQAAHLAALEAIKNLELNDDQLLTDSNLPLRAPFVENKKEKKQKIEFEINEDVIKFYEQSLIYKREKSMYIN